MDGGPLGLTSSLVLLCVLGSHRGFQQGRTRSYLQLEMISVWSVEHGVPRWKWGDQRRGWFGLQAGDDGGLGQGGELFVVARPAASCSARPPAF